MVSQCNTRHNRPWAQAASAPPTKLPRISSSLGASVLKNEAAKAVFSPTDLVRYMGSPFTSWMDRYHLECPGQLEPDATTEDAKLIQNAGLAHEAAVLEEFRAGGVDIATIEAADFASAHEATVAAFAAGRPLVYQAALKIGRASCRERG